MLHYNVLGKEIWDKKKSDNNAVNIAEKNKNIGPAFGAVMLMHVKSSLSSLL